MSNEKNNVICPEDYEHETENNIKEVQVCEEASSKDHEEERIETPKKSWFWIKNSSGESSASITFLFVAFWVTTAMFILGHIGSVQIGDDINLQFNNFDSTAAAVYYIPLMMLYFKRREFESTKPGRPGLLELALSRNNNNN